MSSDKPAGGPATINSNNQDVQQVAAALADACHAGGLSDGYYRTADDALARLAIVSADQVDLAALVEWLTEGFEAQGSYFWFMKMPGAVRELLPPKWREQMNETEERAAAMKLDGDT